MHVVPRITLAMTSTAISLSNAITAEIASAVATIAPDTFDLASSILVSAPRIFTFGEGRSGLALRMGAMRLVHLGKIVHIVGDATTPAISPGDVFIVASGSGETNVTVLIADQGRKAGAHLLVVTATQQSRLANLADTLIHMSTPSKGNPSAGQSVQAGGSLFEQSLLIVLDTLFLLIAGTDAEATISAHHANLE